MNHLLRHLSVACAISGSVLLGGCAVSENDEELVDSVASAMTEDPNLACGRDPVGQQRRASKIAAWVLGAEKVDREVAGVVKIECVNRLREDLAREAAKIKYSMPIKVECGDEGIIGTHYVIDGAGDLIGCALTVQENYDVGPFFAYNSQKQITMDPEPAVTQTELSGSNGATAAAVTLNSNTPTTVVKWGTNLAPGRVPAGTPCSPDSLKAYEMTTKMIQAIGGSRRCI